MESKSVKLLEILQKVIPIREDRQSEFIELLEPLKESILRFEDSVKNFYDDIDKFSQTISGDFRQEWPGVSTQYETMQGYMNIISSQMEQLNRLLW
jgi:hypothetical protein